MKLLRQPLHLPPTPRYGAAGNPLPEGEEATTRLARATLGSARASRAGDGAPAIANFFLVTHCNISRRRRIDCGEAPQSAREGRALPRVALASRVAASSPSGRGLR